ncbi:hypothetical protein KPL37_13930 [Clostridium frigoris]|uniref:DUF2680 domain-containing protein n=1 Tax=Clostridium frigoris TaxID=205327 RepID=A0ABS6BV81_9CLOT|nr:hypothetical protein [Clostridium frigoris]MBU3160841.1 hypothetical protein [Clostridium frigoris]
MKNKVMILIIAGILTVGGISVAYAANKTVTLNDSNRSMMGTQKSGTQSNNTYNNMIKIMKDSGFSDEATAMKNGNYDAMNKLMNNLSDKDYKKMIEIMKKNGYAPMAKMMQSQNGEDMTKIHQSMMGR